MVKGHDHCSVTYKLSAVKAYYRPKSWTAKLTEFELGENYPKFQAQPYSQPLVYF